MRSLVKWGSGKEGIDVREVPEPKIDPYDILLDVIATGN